MMAMPEQTYDPLAGSRWLQSLTPVRTRTDGDGGDGRPRVHNFHGMTPALAARAYERVLNRADLESHAREQIPVAIPIDDPMPPQTTPARPPEQEMPPAPTQAAPTVPAPVPPSAPTPPGDRDSADEDIQHLMATPHNPSASTTSVPSTAVPSSALPVQPEVTPSAVAQAERDPLLDANGPNSDPLPMPSTSGREVGKPWIEERPGGSTVEYTIPEGNGHNTVDAVVRDAEGNVVSRARIVRVEGTGTYRRWQDDVGGGASYYESGDSDTVGYGQHFAPGSSTSGPPTSEFEASPDLTRVRTASYDDNGRLVGVDVGSKNSIGLYDNVHSDLFDNRTFSSASFSPSGGLVSTFTGQIDSLGNGWVADSDGERWEVYPDDNGNLVQRRINHDTNGYEFKYSVGGVGVHELRDKSGRLLALSQFDADGELIKKQIRVGGQLATGFPKGAGQVEFRFTDRSLIGSSMFVMPWEDRPGPRAGRVISTPYGIRISYDDGEVLQFGHDGGLTSHRAPVDSRALWKRAVSFAGSYYYGLGIGAVGTVEGIGALTGLNDSINSAVALTGSSFRLSSRDDAVNALFHGIGEIGVTAFNAYKTLGMEGAGHIFGDRSWSDSWRNIRRATGANWNATSKFFIGTDWEGASHHLPETLGQAAFGTAMFFVPVRALGALGKGGDMPRPDIPKLPIEPKDVGSAPTPATGNLGHPGRSAVNPIVPEKLLGKATPDATSRFMRWPGKARDAVEGEVRFWGEVANEVKQTMQQARAALAGPEAALAGHGSIAPNRVAMANTPRSLGSGRPTGHSSHTTGGAVSGTPGVTARRPRFKGKIVDSDTRLPDGEILKEGEHWRYDNGNVTYYFDKNGDPKVAYADLNPPINYKKRRLGKRKPIGFIDGVDNRGHLVPEAGVVNYRDVNIQANLIAQQETANLSPKKVWENAAIAYAKTHPGIKMQATVLERDATGRPTLSRYTLYDALGQEIPGFRVIIDNPRVLSTAPKTTPRNPVYPPP